MAVDAGTIFAAIRVELDKLKGDLKKSDAAFEKFAKENEKDSKKVEKNWTTAFKGIGIAGVISIAAVTKAFVDAVKVFARTEQSLANVRAVTNSTAAEFQLLEEAANTAGEQTRFSASQAADALFFLASAGFTAQESIESLDATLLLAGATGSELSQTAQTLTATISQFNLTAEDSVAISNTFAAANSNSQATLTRLQGALRQVGPVAGGLNKSLEETVGVLQLLFNAGFEGETAGRILKSALADLGTEASPTIEKLTALGVAFDDVNPAVNDLATVFGNLQDANLSANEILDAFGKIAGPGIIQLVGAGRDEIEKYTAAVTGTNEAARQYAVQNDTLAGSFDAFRSKLEAFAISFVKLIDGPLRGFIDLGGKILGVFTNFNKGIERSLQLSRTQSELKDIFTEIKKDLPGLAEEYSTLAEKEFLTNEEADRLNTLTNTLITSIPNLTQAELDNAAALQTRAEQQAQLNKQLAEENIALLTAELNKLNEELILEESTVRKQLIGALADLEGQQAITAERAAELRREITLANEFEDFEKAAAALGTSLGDSAPKYQLVSDEAQDLRTQIAEARKELDTTGSEVLDVTTQWQKYQLALLDAREETEDLNGEGEGGGLPGINEQLLAQIEALNNAKEGLRGYISEYSKFAKNVLPEAGQASEEFTTNRLRELEQTVESEKNALKETLNQLANATQIREQFSNRQNSIDEGRARLQEQLLQEQEQARGEALVDELQNEADFAAFKETLLENQIKIAEQAAAAVAAAQVAGTEEALEAAKLAAIALQELAAETVAKVIEAEEFAQERRAELLKQATDSTTEYYNLVESLEDAFNQKVLENADARKKAEEEAIAERREILNNYVTASIGLVDAFYNNEIEQAEGNEEKISDLKRKQFIADKLLKAGQATIAGIVAVLDAGGPFTPAGFATGIAAAAGVVKILAQPVPQFQTGGIVLGSGASTGSNINVAENGSNELLFNSGQAGEAFVQQFAAQIVEAMRNNSPIIGNFNMDKRFLFSLVSDGNESGEIKKGRL